MITTESISKTKEGKLYSSLAAIVSDRERYIEKVEEFLQFEFLLYDSFFLFFDGADFDPKYHIVDLLVALYTEIITEEEFKSYLKEVFQDAIKFQYLLLTKEITEEGFEYLPTTVRGFSLVKELEYLNLNGMKTEIITNLIAAYPEINAEVLIKHLQYNKLTEFFCICYRFLKFILCCEPVNQIIEL